MGQTVYLSLQRLLVMLEEILSLGQPTVYLKDTAPGQEMRRFRDAREVLEFVSESARSGAYAVGLALHYPETAGYVDVHRVALDPRYCDGFDFRYEAWGWGIFLMQIFFDPSASTLHQVAVSCNTRKRAEAWSDTYPELRDPGFWDWTAVEAVARRITRVMKRYGSSATLAVKAPAGPSAGAPSA